MSLTWTATKSSGRESKGIQARIKGFGDIHTNQENGYKITNWALSNYPDDQPGTDLYAIREKKCVSVTPIKIRLHHNKRALENLCRFLVS